MVRKTAGRLRSRFNFSVSELDFQESWQRARLGAVSVGPDRATLLRIAEELVREGEKILGGDLVRHEIEVFDHD